ncbi:hypothetical protein EV188_1011096 [Actinomycetospora succinea]|uniref:Uncharacterized protein n=1 Tax=Actinomycetospora succinea TaxID=663603 RepID=A0A4R6VT72_9PSEU|nr:hypothetical protein [Actinomycetospora succinea]TDQ65844.1 hypothetical protein EV188_1011096 [Actinomycetospora succinea]
MTHPVRAPRRAAFVVPPEEIPGDPGSLVRDALAFACEHRVRLGRLGLHLLVAALPLLAISVHVFGLAPMNVTAGLVVVPLTLAVLLLGVFSPVGEDRIVLMGAIWGVIATLVYDAVRLDSVYLLGWWGDFIPTVGTWILGVDGGSTGVGAVVGYLWRYVGDGGGIGVVFFLLVAATGLRRWGERATVAAAVVFAVFPVWTGLIATVAVAPRGERLMFPLTVTTVTLSLLGHLVFGLVLGLGCARCRGLEERWPWPPLLDRPWAGAAATPDPAPAADDGAWGPPALVARPERTPIPEAPGEITEIRVERPAPRRPGRPARVRPSSGPVVVGPDPGPIPARREPVSGPVRVLGTPSHPVPVVAPPRRPAGPGPWSRAVPPGSDPWLGDRRDAPPRGAASSAKAHPAAWTRG